MSSKCFCTSSTLCSECQNFLEECLNREPLNSERVGPLPELTSSSVVASHEHGIPPEQQLIPSLSNHEGRLHLFSHAHDSQYQPQLQNQSLENILVDVNPINLEKHTISSTRTLQPLQNQPGGREGQMYIKQQMQQYQQSGQLSMTVPTIVKRQEMGTAQPLLPIQPPYVPGNCAKRLIQYMHQLHRNANASTEFWREVVTEFFASNAKKRWCFSLCKKRPIESAPFAQRMWQCEVCKQKPGCGYEVTAGMLPMLSRVGYETGILQELVYVDMPSEHQRVSGEIVVHYDKATVELVYQNLRIAHEGHLCIVFTPDLKISSWDFCIRDTERLVSDRCLTPQVNNLEFQSRNYNRAAENALPYFYSSKMKSCSDMLAKEAFKFQSNLNLPPVTDVGFTRRYLRRIQMLEVLASMEDLLDHTIATGMGPRMSLAILGGSSSQDRVPDSNTKQSRPLVQSADKRKIAPDGGRSYACTSSRIPPAAFSPYACTSSRIPPAASSPYACTSSRIPPAASSPYASTSSRIPPAASSPYACTSSQIPPAAASRYACTSSRFPPLPAASSPYACTSSRIPPAAASPYAYASSRFPPVPAAPSPYACTSSRIPPAAASPYPRASSRFPPVPAAPSPYACTSSRISPAAASPYAGASSRFPPVPAAPSPYACTSSRIPPVVASPYACTSSRFPPVPAPSSPSSSS